MSVIEKRLNKIITYFKHYFNNYKLQMEAENKDKVAIWARTVDSGSTYGKSTSMISHNDKYALFYKKPTTEYIDRMAGSGYAGAEYYVLPLFADDVTHVRGSKRLFNKEGRLTNEDKLKLQEDFGLVIPKKEINKKLTEDIWAVILLNSTQGFYEFFDSDLQIHKVVKINPTSIEVDIKGTKKSYSNTKHNIKQFTVEEEAVKEFLKLKSLIDEYNDLILRKRQKMSQIKQVFDI